MTLDLRKHHARKEPRRVKRTISEKRRRPTMSEASAARVTRGGNEPRPGRRR